MVLVGRWARRSTTVVWVRVVKVQASSAFVDVRRTSSGGGGGGGG
jgi:hypothetical protein